MTTDQLTQTTVATDGAGILHGLLVEAGATDTAARQIAASVICTYLGLMPTAEPVRPDALDDLTPELRGLAWEIGHCLTVLARAAGRAACPNVGPAMDHSAAALRLALAHAEKEDDDRCPISFCRAKPGEPCVSSNGRIRSDHGSRLQRKGS